VNSGFAMGLTVSLHVMMSDGIRDLSAYTVMIFPGFTLSSR
jgi:hypothetical protein